MNTTQTLLARVKELKGLTSDYQLAKLLGVSRQAVSHWQNGRHELDQTTAVQVAELLQVDPMQVMAELQCARASNTRERHVWERYRGRVHTATVAAVAVLAGISGGVTVKSDTIISQISALPGIHYAQLAAWLRQRLSRPFAWLRPWLNAFAAPCGRQENAVWQG